MQIEPLVAPTRAIMQQTSVTYTWHEFFPNGNLRYAQATSNENVTFGTWIDVD